MFNSGRGERTVSPIMAKLYAVLQSMWSVMTTLYAIVSIKKTDDNSVTMITESGTDGTDGRMLV